MSQPERFDYNYQQGRKGKEIEIHNAEMCAQLEAELYESKCPVTILSSEHCGFLDASEIHKLSEYLRSLFDEIEILFFARHPAYHAASLAQESVKNGAIRLADVSKNIKNFGVRERILRWQSVFGMDAVRCLCYPGDPPNRGDVTEVFLDAIGWNKEVKLASITANASISGAAILLADALTEIAPKRSRQRFAQKYLKSIKGPKLCFPQPFFERIMANSKEDLRYLEITWGISFEPTPVEADVTSTEYFTEEALHSLAALLNDLSRLVDEGVTGSKKTGKR